MRRSTPSTASVDTPPGPKLAAEKASSSGARGRRRNSGLPAGAHGWQSAQRCLPRHSHGAPATSTRRRRQPPRPTGRCHRTPLAPGFQPTPATTVTSWPPPLATSRFTKMTERSTLDPNCWRDPGEQSSAVLGRGTRALPGCAKRTRLQVPRFSESRHHVDARSPLTRWGGVGSRPFCLACGACVACTGREACVGRCPRAVQAPRTPTGLPEGSGARPSGRPSRGECSGLTRIPVPDWRLSCGDGGHCREGLTGAEALPCAERVGELG